MLFSLILLLVVFVTTTVVVFALLSVQSFAHSYCENTELFQNLETYNICSTTWWPATFHMGQRIRVYLDFQYV